MQAPAESPARIQEMLAGIHPLPMDSGGPARSPGRLLNGAHGPLRAAFSFVYGALTRYHAVLAS